MSVNTMKIAGTLAGSLFMGQVVTPSTNYEAKSSMLAGLLVLMFTEDADRMVERLTEENAEIREIMQKATKIVVDQDLAGRAAAALDAAGSLRVSVLQQENDRLRTLLVEVHAHVETIEGAPAVDLEEKIWAELRASAGRRTLSTQPL